jgi:hypothetical protein
MGRAFMGKGGDSKKAEVQAVLFPHHSDPSFHQAKVNSDRPSDLYPVLYL